MNVISLGTVTVTTMVVSDKRMTFVIPVTKPQSTDLDQPAKNTLLLCHCHSTVTTENTTFKPTSLLGSPNVNTAGFSQLPLDSIHSTAFPC